MNLLCLFQKQKSCIGLGNSSLYFHLVFVFFALRLLKLVFISHRSDTGFTKESSSPGVAVLPRPKLEVLFKPKVPSHSFHTMGSLSDWSQEGSQVGKLRQRRVERDAFLQHWHGHSTSTHIAHVEGFFASGQKSLGRFCSTTVK